MANDLDVRFISQSDPEFYEARRLRYAVLYEPLGIPESAVDWDEAAMGVTHCVVFVRGDLAGYGRVQTRGTEAQIRHLAVSPDHRGHGIGSALLDALVGQAKQRGALHVFLNARFTALGMYRSRGFDAVGPVFHTESTHLPHQRMELAL